MLHGDDEKLGPLRELVAADAERAVEAVGWRLEEADLGDVARRLEQADVLAVPVEPFEPPRDLGRPGEEVRDAGEEVVVDPVHRLLGEVVELGVREARRDVWAGEVVVDPEVVVEEREDAIVANRVRRWLGADDQVRSGEVERPEPFEQPEEPEGLPGPLPDGLGDLDPEGTPAHFTDRHEPPLHVVPGPGQSPAHPLHDRLETARHAVVGLDDRDAHQVVGGLRARTA
ncbi:MAG: hypothetical protein M5U14_22120 [Acidimicrobiia bacterium]|nr:hypothetical protein [Acidimicrobiia bacterium]